MNLKEPGLFFFFRHHPGKEMALDSKTSGYYRAGGLPADLTRNLAKCHGIYDIASGRGEIMRAKPCVWCLPGLLESQTESEPGSKTSRFEGHISDAVRSS